MGAPKAPKTRLGAAIRAARLTLGWKNQERLRKELDAIGYVVSQDTISEWERGDRIPRPDEVIALERVLDLSAEGTLREARDRDAEEHAEAIMSAAIISADTTDPGQLRRLVTNALNATGCRTFVLTPPRSLAFA